MFYIPHIAERKTTKCKRVVLFALCVCFLAVFLFSGGLFVLTHASHTHTHADGLTHSHPHERHAGDSYCEICAHFITVKNPFRNFYAVGSDADLLADFSCRAVMFDNSNITETETLVGINIRMDN